MRIRIRAYDKWCRTRTHWNNNRYGALFANSRGVLYGQEVADPVLMRISLNIVRRHGAMRVTVQNGASHCLSRFEVEAMLEVFPHAWHSAVETILLARGEEQPKVVFYPKAKELALYCSKESASVEEKSAAVVELLVGIAAVAQGGPLPQELNFAHRRRLVEGSADLQAKCFGLLR